MKIIQLLTGLGLAIILFFGCAGLPGSRPESGVEETSLAGPVWFLAGYLRESGFVPLEPGHGSTARIVFQKNGSFEGTTGWSIFSGTWNARGVRSNGTSTARFSPAAFSSSAAGADAKQFEQDIIRSLRNTRSIKRGTSAVRFLDASGQPLLDFISSVPAR